MADNMKTHKIGVGLDPQAAAPSNPKTGDMYNSDGTPAIAGIYEYDGSAFRAVSNHTSLVAPSRYDTNAGQTIGTGATRIDFEDIDYDDDSLVTTGGSWVWTCPTDGTGKYIINSVLGIDSTNLGASASCQIEVVINSVAQARKDMRIPDAPGVDHSISIHTVQSITAGHTVYITLLCSDADAIALDINRLRNYIEIYRIA